VAIVAYHVKSSAVPFGWAAVDLFFVLSGYLITSILVKYEGTPGLLGRFYVRRGLRIWPIYYLTILALVAFGPFLPYPTLLRGLPYYATYTQNVPLYWSDRVPPFSPYASHLWTLANEEQFYLLWPPLVCLVGRRHLLGLALALAAVSVVARAVGFDTWLLLARADGFALGGLLAALLARPEAVRQRMAVYRTGFILAVVVALAVLVFTVSRGSPPTFGRPPRGSAFSVLAINTVFFGIVGLVATHAGRPSLAWLRVRALVRLGTISYGFYLYHFLTLMIGGDLVAKHRGAGRSLVLDGLFVALAYVLAVLSWKWIEKPILALKDRFAYEERSCERSASHVLRPAHARNYVTELPEGR
jgi:peptidoglycan/LPS O-acetylase OafA/YrhL